jgi:hypothetical protein
MQPRRWHIVLIENSFDRALRNTGQSPHDGNLLLDTVADEDLILPNTPVTPAEAKLVALAKLAMKKAVNGRPHSVAELLPLLFD